MHQARAFSVLSKLSTFADLGLRYQRAYRTQDFVTTDQPAEARGAKAQQ